MTETSSSSIAQTKGTFQLIPAREPPSQTVGVRGWVRKNLFSTPLNTLITFLLAFLVIRLAIPALDWGVLKATFIGDGPKACTEGAGGACWLFVAHRFRFFMFGFYPQAEQWRIVICFALLMTILIPQFFDGFRYKLHLGVLGVTVFPVICTILFLGGWFGLPHIPTDKWGGLSLTLVLASVGIVASLPLGILLAMGRRSKMGFIRGFSAVFIEVWRGAPLLMVLFMSSVMLPLFLPEGVTLDKLMRALIGITLWQSSYMAEVVRGGLQAIPRGQTEAAQSLGLGYWRTMGLIVLPQALKIVIPGIVNIFIALFMDTTLVLIIGLFDILAVVQTSIGDPSWGRVAMEGYLFAAGFYWIFCYGMSRYSRTLEKKLNRGHKR